MDAKVRGWRREKRAACENGEEVLGFGGDTKHGGLVFRCKDSNIVEGGGHPAGLTEGRKRKRDDGAGQELELAKRVCPENLIYCQ